MCAEVFVSLTCLYEINWSEMEILSGKQELIDGKEA